MRSSPRCPQPDGVRGAIVRVEVPSVGFEHASAAGLGREDTGEAVTVDHRLHVASVGKMFTATLVLQAAESGLFGPDGIDTALGELAFAPGALVTGVHPLGPTITIRQLLTHTSGMKDMQADDATGTADELGRPAPDSVVANFWRSARGLAAGDRSNEFALAPLGAVGSSRPRRPDGRHAQPLPRNGHRGRPGRRTRRALPLQRHGLRAPRPPRRAGDRPPVRRVAARADHRPARPDPHHAGLPRRGPRRSTRRPWGDGRVARRHRTPECGLDLSLDWGGGGQVSTVADLCRFLRGLLAGELFDDPTTIEMSTTWAHPAHLPPQRLGVGLGLFHWQAGVARAGRPRRRLGRAGVPRPGIRQRSSPEPSGNEMTARG